MCQVSTSIEELLMQLHEARTRPGAPRRIWTYAAAIVATIGLLAGCSAGSPSAPAATAGGPGPAAAATGSGAAVGGGASAGAAIDVCALLPVDQVASITKVSLTTSTSRTSGAIANDSGCTYGTSAVASVVLIDVITPGGAVDYAARLARFGADAVSIPGVGDKAFQALNDYGPAIVALFGDTELDVHAGDPTNTLTQAQQNALEVALIKAMKAKL